MDLSVSVTIDLSDRVVDLIEGFLTDGPSVPADEVIDRAIPPAEHHPHFKAPIPPVIPTLVEAVIDEPPPFVAPAPATVELDAEGLPWDQRIHSSGQTQYATSSAKNKKDTWKLKKGVSPVLVGQVKTELRGVYPDPSGVTETLPDAPPAAAAIPEAGAITQWGQLMTAITEAGITPEQTHAACIAMGLSDVNALFSNPQAVPAVAQSLGLTQ